MLTMKNSSKVNGISIVYWRNIHVQNKLELHELFCFAYITDSLHNIIFKCMYNAAYRYIWLRVLTFFIFGK